MLKAPQYGRRRKRMSGPVNQHKEYASTGKPSQQDTEYKGKEPKATDFGWCLPFRCVLHGLT